MTSGIGFVGFPKECPEFFKELSRNNNHEWFAANKQHYEQYVLAPARLLVDAMGTRLYSLAPGLYADPRVEQSVLKAERGDGQEQLGPYKTHLALWFWEGLKPRLQCSGFYFHLESDKLLLGVGVFQFSPEILQAYRRAVAHEKKGDDLAKLVKDIVSRPGYSLGGRNLSQVPEGFETFFRWSDWLKHDGLTVTTEAGYPRALYSDQLVEYCLKRYHHMAPLHTWLRDVVSSAM